MAGPSIFDQLSAEISAQERRELLDRIAASARVSDEPLFKAGEIPREESYDYAAKAASLGFVARLLLALRSVFSGKSRESLLRDDDLREIARRIESRYPLIIDRHRSILLPGMAEELRKLRDAARFFYDVLDRSVERDRPAFFAFLVSIEMPALHERLLEDTDPFKADRPEARDEELRRAMHEACEIAIADMDEAGRRAIYRDLRSLIFLKRLSGFLFERLLGIFRPGLGPEGAEAAGFSEVRELLLDLGDLMRSMSEPPSAALMEALFIFVEREKIAQPEAESILTADMGRAESALGRIRAFNARVPLAELSRLVSGEPGYQPRELAGGEDWLAVFRSFWRERIDAKVEEWKEDRRYRQLAEEIVAFVGEPGPVAFANISREQGEAVPPLRLEGALSFLDAFARGIYQRELARPLKIVLVDGEFYRKENRLEFTDAFDALAHLSEALSALDARLGSAGDIGSAWAAAKAEVSPASVKQRRLETIARDAEYEAERILRSVAKSLSEMVRLLGGILKGEAGGRYDSLANLSSLDGRANRDLLRSLSAAKDRCERSLTFLLELSGLDLGNED